ncbi:MAG: LamG domain-containing protein [bacterium]|nr:LamG domain-containing protein [bacterium]
MALPTTDLALALDIDQRVCANAAADFDGSTQYLSQTTSDFDPDPTADWYWSAWLRPASGLANNTVFFEVEDSGTYVLRIRWNTTAGGRFQARYDNDGLGHSGVAKAVGADDAWYFVEVWWDASATTLYVTADRETPVSSNFGGTNSAWHTLAEMNVFAAGGSASASGRASVMTCVEGSIPDDDDKDALFNGGLGRGADYVKNTWGATATYCWPLHEASSARAEIMGNGTDLTDNNSVGVAGGVSNDRMWSLTTHTDYWEATSGWLPDFTEKWMIQQWVYVRDGSVDCTFFKGEWDTAGTKIHLWCKDWTDDLRALITVPGDNVIPACTGNALSADGWHLAELEWDPDILGGQATVRLNRTGDSDSDDNDWATLGSTTSMDHVRIGDTAEGNENDWQGKYLFIYQGEHPTDAERDWWYNGGAGRSYDELYAAKVRGTGDGSGMYDKIDYGFVRPVGDGLTIPDLFGDMDLDTIGGSPVIIETNPLVTDHLLTDVSAAGVDLDNAKVFRWEDVSGEDNHVFQTTTSIQPLYETNSGSPRVRAGTAGNKLGNTFTKLSSGGCIVVRAAFGDIANTYLYDGGDGTDRWALIATGTQWYAYGGGITAKYGTSDTSAHTWYTTYDVASDDHRVDGTQLSTTDTGSRDIDGVTLLERASGSNAHANTEITRYALYSAVLAGGDKTDAEYSVENGFDASPPGGSSIPVFMHHYTKNILAGSR